MIALYLFISSSENIVKVTDESLSIGRTKISDLEDIIDTLTQEEIFYNAAHLFRGPTPNAFIREERVAEICLSL